ncbi:hypothetical protein D3C83_244410 [compost metagenome]
MQKELAIQMPTANTPGVAPFLTFAQPWIANWATWAGAGVMNPQEITPNYWYDASKKT